MQKEMILANGNVADVKENEKGFTILEVTGAFLFGLIITAGSALLVSELFGQGKIAELQDGISYIRMNTQQMFSGSNDYTGLDTAAVIASGAVPSKMVDGTDIKTPWGDAMTVAVASGTDADTNTFTITVPNLDQDACIKMAQFQSYAWEDITVGDGSTGTSTMGKTAPEASKLCTGDAMTIVYKAR